MAATKAVTAIFSGEAFVASESHAASNGVISWGGIEIPIGVEYLRLISAVTNTGQNMTRLTLLMILMASSVVQAATYYAQNSSVDINSASLWNTAANGSGDTLTWASLDSADILCANGKTAININVGFTCAKITTETLDGAGGGGFTLSTNATINCDIVAGTTPCITCVSATYTVTINATNITGGTAANARGIFRDTNTATLIINATNITGGSNATATGFRTNGAGTVTITATDITGVGGSGVHFGVPSGTHTVAATRISGSSTTGQAYGLVSANPSLVVSGSMVNTLYANAVEGKLIYNPAATDYIEWPAPDSTTKKYYYDIPDAANVLATDTVAGVDGTFECDDDLADNPFRSPAFG
jgi:hypothetical protein